MNQNPLSADLHHILDHTRDLWEDLRGARLFITGGTGFFGCWLLESFLFANQQLDLKASASVLTRRPDSVKQALPHLMLNPAITLVSGDVRDFEFPKGGFSHVIHAASESSAHLSADNLLTMFNTIVNGAQRALEFADQSNAQKFLFTSSGAVYGPQDPALEYLAEDSPFRDYDDPPDMRSVYSQGKRAAELLTKIHAGKMSTTIARCFAFVGPYLPLDSHFAAGNFIRDGLAGKPIEVNGDGTPLRSYLYAADLAIWLWTILLKGDSGTAYNVGSEQAISIGELAQTVAGLFDPSPPVIVHQKTPLAGKLPARYIPSTRRAAKTLGLEAWIPVPDSFRRTIQWHENQIPK
ncbi:MAG: NAD-dependent epimerase/dehydratase family protein [Chloroflexi bacterium]|nr:NAD-dependent epimerase/dehydratase family protein [Chloroflexota bacterium]